MALKKTYGSRIENGIEVEPQRDVDMHPLEEACILLDWKMGEEFNKIPLKPSIKEEHEWLIEHGPDYIKKKREEWQVAYDAQKAIYDKCEQEFHAAHKIWCDHAMLCHTNGHNPDTFAGDARLTLKMPEDK